MQTISLHQSSMNQQPRQILRDLISQYGTKLADAPRRCEQMLREQCGSYRPEIHLLVSAAKEQIPAQLLASPVGSREMLLTRLARRLQFDRVLPEAPAWWAIEAWGFALGIDMPADPPRMAVVDWQALDDFPRRKLGEVLSVDAHDNRVMYQDSRRCEAILRDLCPERQREIAVLIAAQDEHIPEQLLAGARGNQVALTQAALVQQLSDTLFLPESAAQWAVDAWSDALAILGVIAVRALELSLHQNNEQAVIAGYLAHQDLLEVTSEFTGDIKQRVRGVVHDLLDARAARLRRAIFEKNDAQIAAEYAGYEQFLEHTGGLSPIERERAWKAVERTEALAKLREALSTGRAATIMRVYNEHEQLLLANRGFSSVERQKARHARQKVLQRELRSTISRGSAEQIIEVADRAIAAGYVPADDEYAAIDDARRSAFAYKQLIEAFDRDNDAAILAASNTWLLRDVRVSDLQRKRVLLAEARLARIELLRRALLVQNDAEIVRLYDRELFDGFAGLSINERERCVEALRRFEAWEHFQNTLNQGQGRDIADAYRTSLVHESSLLTDSQRRLGEAAISTEIHVAALQSAVAAGSPDAISRAVRAADDANVRLPDTFNWSVVLDACRLEAKRTQFDAAFSQVDTPDADIASLGWPLLLTAPSTLTADQQGRIVAAMQHTGAALRTSERESTPAAGYRPEIEID